MLLLHRLHLRSSLRVPLSAYISSSSASLPITALQARSNLSQARTPTALHIPASSHVRAMATSAPTTRTALVLPRAAAPVHLDLTNTPLPSADPGSVVVRVLATAIAPHAGYMLTGAVPHFTFPTPFVPGHGGVARVLTAGPDATALRPGQLVWVDNFVRSRDDPERTQILLGLYDGGPGNAPANKLMRDVWRDAMWTDVARVPLENAVPLDEARLLGAPGDGGGGGLGYAPADVAMLNRLAVAYGANRAAGVRPGAVVLVAPATGHFGGAAAEVAVALGAARVLAAGRNAAVLAQMRAALGARLEPVVLSGADDEADGALVAAAMARAGGADCFIDFSPGAAAKAGNPVWLGPGLAGLKHGGTAVLNGGVPGDVTIPYWGVMIRGIRIQGRYMYSRAEAAELVGLVESGLLKLGPAAGHVTAAEFALKDWEPALKEASKNTDWGRQVVFIP